MILRVGFCLIQVDRKTQMKAVFSCACQTSQLHCFQQTKTCLLFIFGRNNLRKKSRHLSFAHNIYILYIIQYIFTHYCNSIQFHSRWGIYSYLGTSARLLGRGGRRHRYSTLLGSREARSQIFVKWWKPNNQRAILAESAGEMLWFKVDKTKWLTPSLHWQGGGGCFCTMMTSTPSNMSPTV